MSTAKTAGRGNADAAAAAGDTGRYAARVAAADWDNAARELDGSGCALLPRLLTPAECAQIAGLYDEPERFRATIDMARHRFGSGEYRYFKAPFPEPVEALRRALYERLLPIARDWFTRLRRVPEWPDTLEEWLEICHAAGQTRPTPILLRYQAGDWNALHRDLYGDKVFPLQVVVNLNDPGTDHTGGEFLLVEQRPRAQSRGIATTIPPRATGRSPRPAAGRRRRSGTASPPSGPAAVTPSGWSFTTPRELFDRRVNRRAGRPADSIEIPERLPVRVHQAGLAIAHIPLPTEIPDQGLGAPQARAWHGGEQVVLDLVVQAAQREVGQPATTDVAGRQHLAAQEVSPVSRRQDRHAFVVGGERAAQVQAEQTLLHQHEDHRLHG